jgi:hypothetical protein
VQFFYLTLMRRARDRGLPRQISETPNEYKQKLKGNLPDLDEDLDAFTETFLEARYSLHPITADQAGLARKIWSRLRKSLRTFRSRR